MSANDRQFGGTHYAGEYQHWDWVYDVNLDYHAGNASKYVYRWRKKNGLEDLMKCGHYLTKRMELKGMPPVVATAGKIKATNDFCDANDVDVLERVILMDIAGGRFDKALEILQTLISTN